MREPCDESLKSVRKGDMQLPRKNLPDRASSVKFLRLKRSWLRTLALILSEVRSHWRISVDQCHKMTCFVMRVQAVY